MKSKEKSKGVADLLGKLPLGTVIWKLTYPAFIGKVCEGLFSVVDAIFIGKFVGKTPEERSVALASISFAMPIDSALLNGVALWYAHGANPVYGSAVGQNNSKLSKRILGNLLFLCIFFGVLIPLVYPLFMEPLLLVLGASKITGTFQFAYDYIMILVYGIFFVNTACSANSIVRAEGSALYSLILVVEAATFNALLCPVFIDTFNLGVRGASSSTIFAEFVSTLLGLYYFLSGRSIVVPSFKDLIPDFSIIGQILNAGLASLLLGIAPSILTVVTNRIILQYSIDPESIETTAALAASGALSKINSFCLMPVQALALGSTSIMAYCQGANLKDRFITTAKTCFYIQIIISFILTIVGYFGARGIATIFGGDPIFIEILTFAIRYSTSALVFIPFYNILQPILQTTGRGYIGGILVFLRSCIIPIVFQFIICYWRKDFYGAFFAYPCAEMVSALVSILIFCCIKNNLLGKKHSEPVKI
ncbi:hypothetical protein WA158_005364 [Blastocystis sp. Blastoise]